MKQDTIARIVRATIAKYLNQTRMDAQPSHVEKSFVWMDKTGRNPNASKIGSRRILNTWNLTQLDWTTAQTLGGFLKNCKVDDTWRSKTEMLKCLSIEYHKGESINH